MDFLFKKDDLSFFEALSLEWLETNGLGGYASSTILNCNTRKYHGLLISNHPEFKDKHVLLSQLIDTFSQESDEYPLYTIEYPDACLGESFSFYQECVCNTHPIFTYQCGKATITKELLMIDQEDTILIKYTINKGAPGKMTINPLIAFRNFHLLSKENDAIQTQINDCIRGKTFTLYPNTFPLFFQTDADFDFSPNAIWHKNVKYEKERKRGFDYLEDLFSPGCFSFPLSKKQAVILSCSTTEQTIPLAEKWEKEIKRRSYLFKKTKGTPLQRQLKKTSLSFIQTEPQSDELSIIAGYPWFSVWGRDTLISLPGFTLYSGLENECLMILQEFCKKEYKGLFPNTLGRHPEENTYNAVDTSLWFAWAVQQYYLKTKNIKQIIQHFWSTLSNIFFHYKEGTLFYIKMQENGLLSAGIKETNVTWMDTVINGTPITPRSGYIVEVNALWFNMLCFMQTLAKKLSDPLAAELKALTDSIIPAFRETFWDNNLGYLKDYVNDEIADTSIRPNQILAVSLPYTPLTKSMAGKVVETVKDHLLTPYGLRTLSPEDPYYKKHYNIEEGFEVRERAYHNGTVWPWLLGHFGEALLKTTRNKKEATKLLNGCLKKLQLHLANAGIGCISEIFDGDLPHKPDGCISQAWSIAEILRLTYLLQA